MTVPCFSPLPALIDRKGSGKPVPGPWAHPDHGQGENPSHQNRPPADQGALHRPDEERAAWHSMFSAALQVVLFVFSCLGWLCLRSVPGWVGSHLFIAKSWARAVCQACRAVLYHSAFVISCFGSLFPPRTPWLLMVSLICCFLLLINLSLLGRGRRGSGVQDSSKCTFNLVPYFFSRQQFLKTN